MVGETVGTVGTLEVVVVGGGDVLLVVNRDGTTEGAVGGTAGLAFLAIIFLMAIGPLARPNADVADELRGTSRKNPPLLLLMSKVLGFAVGLTPGPGLNRIVAKSPPSEKEGIVDNGGGVGVCC